MPEPRVYYVEFDCLWRHGETGKQRRRQWTDWIVGLDVDDVLRHVRGAYMGAERKGWRCYAVEVLSCHASTRPFSAATAAAQELLATRHHRREKR